MPNSIANKIKLPDNTIVELNDNRIIVSNPRSGQVLSYDSTNNYWANQTIDIYDGIIPLEYNDLCYALNNNELIPGQKYRITDYVTTTSTSNTSSAGNAFDLIVTAIDTNKLDSQAQAINHVPAQGQTDYFVNSNLSKWQVWYDINNDTTKYAWAKSTANGGRGVIYRLIDEFGNDCPYDFKNIKFSITYQTSNAYTFNLYANSTCSDHSLNGRYCYENVMKPYYNNGVQNLNFNVFYNSIATSTCSFNIFGDYCYYNIFGDYCSNNTFACNCNHNTFGGYCSDNTFGVDGSNNIFGNYCSSNIFENYSRSNTFNSSCQCNKFGEGCRSNYFNSNCNYNKFGTNSLSNTFGINCNCNIFGNECYDNEFKDDCSHNTFDNYCISNSFRYDCSYNTLGNNCNNIVFGDSQGIGGNYCKNNIIENGNQYIRLYQINNEDSSNYLQNIYIAQGVNDSLTEYVISTIARKLPYRTTIAKESDGTLMIYNEDDVPTLSGLKDTTITSAINGQVLTYNSSLSKWVNAAVPTEIPSQSGNSGKFLTTNGTSVSWANAPTELPSLTGNANKVLAVNSGATGVEWITNSGGGGLMNYDFTELSAPTISAGATTITFAANQRNGVEFSTNADLSIALISNNKSDNYIWITNSHNSNDIDVTFSSISFGATPINDVIGTDSIPTIAHGETLEIGIYVTSDKARITSRIL